MNDNILSTVMPKGNSRKYKATKNFNVSSYLFGKFDLFRTYKTLTYRDNT